MKDERTHTERWPRKQISNLNFVDLIIIHLSSISCLIFWIPQEEKTPSAASQNIIPIDTAFYELAAIASRI